MWLRVAVDREHCPVCQVPMCWAENLRAERLPARAPNADGKSLNGAQCKVQRECQGAPGIAILVHSRNGGDD